MLLRFFFLLLTMCCFAQQPSHYVIGEEELAGVNIYSIVQGKDNKVWLSTNNGLYVYDGSSFFLLTSDKVNDQSLFGLTLDKQGNVYCHNLSGQVLGVKNNRLVIYCELPQKYISNSLFIAFDDQNKLVISCKDLIRYEDKTKQFSLVFNYKEDIAEKLASDEQSRIYFWNNEKKYTLSQGKLIESPVAVPRLSVLQNHVYHKKGHGLLYFANLSNKALLQKYDDKLSLLTFPVPDKDPSVTLRPLLSLSRDLVWLAGSKNGAYCYRTSGQPLFNNTKLFSNYFISSYLEDHEGNVWLGTFGKGIIVIPTMNVVDYSNTMLLEHDDLTQITAGNKTLFFGGVKGNVYGLSNGEIVIKKKGFNKIEFLKYESKSDRLYVNDKVFDGKLNKELFKNDFNKYDVYENKSNDSVFYVTRSGLFAIDKNQKSVSLNYTTRTYGVYNDEVNKTLWLASSTGLEIKKNNQFKKIKVNGELLFSNSITGIGDEVWVATNAGVFVFLKDKMIKQLAVNNKLLSNKVVKIIYRAPYVYIATNEGLQRFSVDLKECVNFTKSEGLLSNAILDFEVVGNSVYVISSKGLQSFDFTKISNRKKLPEVSITKALVNGNLNVIDGAVLSFDENTIEFDFNAITFLDKRNLKYRFQLKGFEEHWQLANFFDGKVVYNKLPAGEYVFEVQLTDGVNFSGKKVFVFQIEPVFWRKWQFIVFAVVLLIIALYLVYRFRVNYLLQKSQAEIEKEKLSKEINKSKLAALNAQMNPHFMFNALNSIQEFILQNKKEQASNYLGDFADLMRSYLQHSQDDSIVLHDEIEMLKLYLKLEKLRFDDDFTYEVTTLGTVDLFKITIPSFLIQPFVENAIKHGLLHKKQNRHLKVKIEQESDQLIVCTIEDNGIGRQKSMEINKNKKHKSFATQASVDRFQLINQNEKGKVGVTINDLYDENNNPLGTQVVLNIPVKYI